MRKATVERTTLEMEVALTIDVDGRGEGRIDSSVPFLDHMLNLFARHGLVDLTVKGRGDRAIDDHHLVEDLGICLGQAVKKALGDRKGIGRYGAAVVPMDESLASVALDLSGDPTWSGYAALGDRRIGQFDPSLLKEFFKSFSDHSGITLHIQHRLWYEWPSYGGGVFKAFARPFREACAPDGRIEGGHVHKGFPGGLGLSHRGQRGRRPRASGRRSLRDLPRTSTGRS
jgi:imidazoleglycerol-phosphate dehydratase